MAEVPVFSGRMVLWTIEEVLYTLLMAPFLIFTFRPMLGDEVFFLGVVILVVPYLISLTSLRLAKPAVYADRVEFSSTFLAKQVRRIEASKIESVLVRESLLGRSRYGTVTVRGSGAGAIRLKRLAEPEKFAEAVRSVASAAQSKAASQTAGASTSIDLAGQIAQLDALRGSGALSESEFQAAKAKLFQ